MYRNKQNTCSILFELEANATKCLKMPWIDVLFTDRWNKKNNVPTRNELSVFETIKSGTNHKSWVNHVSENKLWYSRAGESNSQWVKIKAVK